jgi:hypothetical protein
MAFNCRVTAGRVVRHVTEITGGRPRHERRAGGRAWKCPKSTLRLSENSERQPERAGELGVIVLSAGSNRTIETRADQSFDSFVVSGDDIVFRIK